MKKLHTQTKKIESVESIESQIKALEYVAVRMIADGKPLKQVFAVNGKIQKLKLKLKELHNFNWLAR